MPHLDINPAVADGVDPVKAVELGYDLGLHELRGRARTLDRARDTAATDEDQPAGGVGAQLAQRDVDSVGRIGQGALKFALELDGSNLSLRIDATSDLLTAGVHDQPLAALERLVEGIARQFPSLLQDNV